MLVRSPSIIVMLMVVVSSYNIEELYQSPTPVHDHIVRKMERDHCS